MAASKSLLQPQIQSACAGLWRTLERVLHTALERNTLNGLTDLLRDPVTGLYTRDGFLTVGRRRQEDALRVGTSLVLIWALFENLHSLRDAFGPGAADRALSDLAQLMKGCCQPTKTHAAWPR